MLCIQCVDVRVVLVVSGLHGAVSTNSVSFPMVGVSPGYSCLVKTRLSTMQPMPGKT